MATHETHKQPMQLHIDHTCSARFRSMNTQILVSFAFRCDAFIVSTHFSVQCSFESVMHYWWIPIRFTTFLVSFHSIPFHFFPSLFRSFMNTFSSHDDNIHIACANIHIPFGPAGKTKKRIKRNGFFSVSTSPRSRTKTLNIFANIFFAQN